MRILLVMDPDLPVPPPLYGGHERLVAMFIEEYTRLGHDVTLLAGPNSKAPTIKTFGKNNFDLNKNPVQRSIEVLQAWAYLYKNVHKFDLIHNFGRLLYLLPVLNKPVKKIMTYGREITGTAIRRINQLPNKNLIFTACSTDCASTGNVAGIWKTVYNAIEFSKYSLQEQVADNAPLMFLGRVEQIKGVLTAIEVAMASGNKLWIAGNIAKEHEVYFEKQIKPLIDGKQIIYLGPLNDPQKNEYLGKSKALLFPIEWDEPFGMVMVEAMACGTPVIAIKRGSVEEVIDEGITGIKVSTKGEIIEALPKLYQINRTACRRKAMERFDVKVIAKEYLSLFNK